MKPFHVLSVLFTENRPLNKTDMREWLRGGASPCQGEGRGFESRLALYFFARKSSNHAGFRGFLCLKNVCDYCVTCFFGANSPLSGMQEWSRSILSGARPSVGAETSYNRFCAAFALKAMIFPAEPFEGSARSFRASTTFLRSSSSPSISTI